MNSGEGVILDERVIKIPHCFLILTPTKDDKCVVVNFTSIKDSSIDIELSVDKGDHPFLTAPSHIPFARADIFSSAALDHFINMHKGTVGTYEKMSSDLHAEILQKLLASKLTPRKVKVFIHENFSPHIYEVIKLCVM